MGGLGFAIQIQKLRDDASPVNAYHYKVWQQLEEEIYAAPLNSWGNEVTTEYYLGDQAFTGLREGEGGEWEASDTELSFVFRDMAGMCSMSYETCWHWTALAFAAIRDSLDVDGWKAIGPTTPIGNYLVTGGPPLAYTEHGMFRISPRTRGKPLILVDEPAGYGDDTRIEWSQLHGTDRDRVEWGALTGLCYCDVCDRYREAWQRTRYREFDLNVAARTAWDLLDGGTQDALEAQALEATRAWSWTAYAGPPELVVLSDWLAGHGAELPIDGVAGIVLTRGRR